MTTFWSNNATLSDYAFVTFSNSNLTINNQTPSYADHCVRVNDGIGSSDKLYIECRFDASSGSVSLALGISNTTHALGAEIGGTSSSFGCFRDDGSTWYNNSQVGTVGAGITLGGTSRLCFAIDRGAGKIWARANNGIWNNTGTDNPATNTGGYNLSAITGTWYLSANMPQENTSDQLTIFPTTASWLYTPPSGFVEYGPIGGRRRFAITI